ncbi:MAG: hypothetical protein QUS33_12145 [Dehalococcoidia bacterium]|nr:hypothetical protein [Dehalococcoidia bacterium]
MQLAVIVLIILGMATAIWLAIEEQRRLREKRRRKLAGWAQASGLKFYPERDYSIGYRYQAFDCLKQGDNRYGCNIVVGTSGRWLVCGFDYHSDTSNAIVNGLVSGRRGCFSALVVDAGVPLKPLSIRPQRLIDRFAEFIGFESIDFESVEFSRRFAVESPDRRWAYDVLHQKTMELMLEYPRFRIDFLGTKVAAYSGDTEFSPDEFQSALNLVTGILDNLPESMLVELKGASSGGASS